MRLDVVNMYVVGASWIDTSASQRQDRLTQLQAMSLMVYPFGSRKEQLPSAINVGLERKVRRSVL
jgi:hypothetical protein